MRKYGICLLVLLLSFNFTACTSKKETVVSASATGTETISSDESSTAEKIRRPLMLNANKKFVKHREVNRRLIRRVHRLHRNRALV
ncbi:MULTISPECIES: hypothetical protein [Legionella]|uniref:Lipoprotein n=1 Tax=Legionella maceachernii TaxID=466 RepID=A0A0W0W428_9GAMM|nr:hypothetical protein [Legionella maceachernii]KTD27128.1 hypothetical protein Lmac_1376 [Legionella maceachernii]SKA14291.1 hypothetical protein SAMN02745128_02280 [Legionella maceachernii]SUP04888.1 Uncharacterised protein [Legionella maceachernii]